MHHPTNNIYKVFGYIIYFFSQVSFKPVNFVAFGLLHVVYWLDFELA